MCLHDWVLTTIKRVRIKINRRRSHACWNWCSTSRVSLMTCPLLILGNMTHLSAVILAALTHFPLSVVSMPLLLNQAPVPYYPLSSGVGGMLLGSDVRNAQTCMFAMVGARLCTQLTSGALVLASTASITRFSLNVAFDELGLKLHHALSLPDSSSAI